MLFFENKLVKITLPEIFNQKEETTVAIIKIWF
jgi:hypothetical protein